MRLTTIVVTATAAAALLLAGCGTKPVVIKTPSASQRLTTVFLRTGERLTLRCGVSLTVPANYDSTMISGDIAQSEFYDSVGTAQGAMKGLLWGFGVRSLTPAGVTWARSTFSSWPVMAASSDQTVVVRSHRGRTTGPQDKPIAMTTTVVTIREPGHPVGVVLLLTFGKHASTSPGTVMAELRTTWRLFEVQGVKLPSKVA